MIRTIHPLYLLGLMLLLLFALIWRNTIMQNEIAYEVSERSNARVMAKRIIELKKVMKAPNQAQMDNFLNGSLFAGSELTHRVKSGRYIINAKAMNARQVQSFLNRILNMSVKVTQLKMESRDDKHVSVHMEIAL